MELRLEKRPTHAVIDLAALQRNLLNSKAFIGDPTLKFMAVVKADAYGHGAVRCALALEEVGVDWFGVAITEEGIELREAGVRVPILCLGSFWPGQEAKIIEHGLTPVIFDLDTARVLDAESRERRVITDYHVKVDTGMGRVGVRHSEIGEFARALAAFSNLRMCGVLTHLASAEDPNQNDFTNQQVEAYDRSVKEVRLAGHDPTIFDMANSPGAFRVPQSRGNLVRLGGALFGLIDDILDPSFARPELAPVMSLRTRIAHIKTVPPGESLGYGRTFFTERTSRVALLPVGYADGYPRSLSNCAEVSILGRRAPVVGRVSMDWTLVDVTDLGEDATVGTEAVLIGDGVIAAELARCCGTLGYEITCGVSPRVTRVYT